MKSKAVVTGTVKAQPRKFRAPGLGVPPSAKPARGKSPQKSRGTAYQVVLSA